MSSESSLTAAAAHFPGSPYDEGVEFLVEALSPFGNPKVTLTDTGGNTRPQNWTTTRDLTRNTGLGGLMKRPLTLHCIN